MKPIYQNPKPELKKIRETLDELVKSVSEIKSILQPQMYRKWKICILGIVRIQVLDEEM